MTNETTPLQGTRPGPAAAPAAPALRVTDVGKRYGAVRALESVTLELVPGEVHALVGENGSGKSTLVGIVSGTVIPDTGGVEIAGAPCRQHTPWESQRHGALTVFQDGSVIPELSVAQNLFLGTPPSGRPSYRQVGGWAAERLAAFGLGHLAPGLQAGKLSAADRQLFDIARAMMARPAVLLLDEATSALDAAGVDVALDLMRDAAADGCAVLLVTHRLSEVFRVADRISVLRDGRYRGTYEPAAIDQAALVELMAGRSIDIEFPARTGEAGEVVLDARSLSGTGYGPIDLRLRRGEIVGIAGAAGNGQLQLLEGLAVVDGPHGDLSVDGRPVSTQSQAWSAGVAYLSSDRRGASLHQNLPIRENLVLGVLGKLSRAGVVTRRREDRQVRESVERYGVRLGSPEDPMTSLSGGNQQKVAIAKVLETRPRVLLCDEPTQGVDVRSRLDIYRMLRRGAEDGLAVVVVSSDAAELAGLCDRVIVLSRGRIVAEFDGEQSSETRIVHAFTGHATGPGLATAPGQKPPVPALRRARLRAALGRHPDATRLGLLALALVFLGAYVQSQESSFLTAAGVYNVLLLAAPLAAIAAAQFVVMYIGGIDISVGGTMSATVCVLSFWVQSASAVALPLALAVGIGTGALAGIGNSMLIERLRVPSVIATIATLGLLQGIGLALRPTPDGVIDPGLTELLTAPVWVFPLPLVVLCVLFVVADRLLRSTGAGLRLRAVGLDARFAYRLGVRAPRLRRLSYVLCGVLAGLAGVILAGQVGVGDPTVGDPYVLLAVAAPIVGGASLLGGRGTFAGCALGSVLLALGLTLPTTLGLGEGWNVILTGGLTVLALALYSHGIRARAGRRARRKIRQIELVSIDKTDAAAIKSKSGRQ
ncbi:ATP-binding cassette domain-containing protein [Amycolatopsis pithecellobii]|uniref:ATP-binding cassette domain-containing protein n=1 Tax=Amycolatopsis pithecellobii TaxID=664692 RepID=A0A6N7YUF5_9PSEU|nr:ATP-binding cassette domain-containing protein [Amycolatopsis pithecellobii]MTD55562.1 ATP-binding cassette domain-containing protein [Amycolatopsis pithecellobii]